MADFFRGIRTSQRETSVSTPLVAESGLPFIVGTAPVHTVNGKVNEVVLCNNYSEAVSAFGYSDDWSKYSICEMMYSHFKLYGMSPLVIVNVLNPESHKRASTEIEFELTGRKHEMPYEVIKESVVVTGINEEAYTEGIDYELFYSGGKLILEVVEGGSMPEDATTILISYDEVDTSAVTKYDIIGGYDPDTKQSSGFELIDQVYSKYLIVPDLLLSPGWSSDSEVAAVMASKAENISGLFQGKALIDADSTTVRHYSDVTAWKSANNLSSKHEIVFWPMLTLGDRLYHYSVHAAGLFARVDTENDGCPSEPPSNKLLKADGTALSDGAEVVLGLIEANYLNSIGIVTAFNQSGGFVSWGNYTACYPTVTDVKDYFISVSRTFSWVASSVIRSQWSKVDSKLDRRLRDSVVDSLNVWMNSLTASGKILGGRILFPPEENSTTDLMSGLVRFHIYLTPHSPAQEMHFILEYDANYLTSSLA